MSVDGTGIEIVKAHVDRDWVVLDLYYAHCVLCDWKGEMTIKLQGAQSDKLDHIYTFKCMTRAGG